MRRLSPSKAVQAALLCGRSTPDPWALLELASDVRPPEYAADHLRQIQALAGLDTAIVVASLGRPEWLTAITQSPVVIEAEIATGLAIFGSP